MKYLRRYTSSPVVEYVSRVLTLALSLFVALVLVLIASSLVGGVSVLGYHLPQPMVLMTVCS